MKVSADFYVVLEPRKQWNNEQRVVGINARRITQHKPRTGKNELAVKVRLTFESTALEEFLPVVEAEVPGGSLVKEAPGAELDVLS